MVAFFPGSVRGINVGSAVEYRGVKIGEVTGVRTLYSTKDRKYDVPVFFETWSDSITTVEEPGASAVEEPSDEELIEVLGLRARLDTKSFVTGQQVVSLEFLPETPVNWSGYSTDGYYKDHFEIPTVASTFEELGRKLMDLDLSELAEKATETLAAIHQLVSNPELIAAIQDIRAGVQDARVLLNSARMTVDEVRPAATSALKQADAALRSAEAAIEEIRPVATRALAQTDATLKTAQDLMDKDSSTRNDLERALQEVANAAEAIRNLAEYINQNPDAFLRGRGQ
ncbi:MAG: MCE family protein [Deltaproteobacteria bacterium]|jgi:paraquat-inducible protein B|nr:MCE family protein [Deltaproteobacteria bacterium]